METDLWKWHDCVCVWGAHRCHSSCITVRGQPQVWASTSTLFEAESLCYWLLCAPGKVTHELWRLACLCCSFCLTSMDTIDMCYHIWLYVASGDLNSCPHNCTGSTLATKPSFLLLDWTFVFRRQVLLTRVKKTQIRLYDLKRNCEAIEKFTATEWKSRQQPKETSCCLINSRQTWRRALLHVVNL